MRASLFVALLAACASTPRVPTAPVARDIVLADADANGILWDDTLYAADAWKGRLLRWDGADGFAVVAEMPPAEEPALGQPARLGDGGFVVPRFGHGRSGAVLLVPREGNPGEVPGLDPKRKRIGATVAPDGRILVAWFSRSQAGEDLGGIAHVSPEGGETDIVTGLGKPIGVLARGDTLYFTDQSRNEVRRCPLAACAAPELVATVPAPDLLAGGADGTLYVTSKDGSVTRVASDGATAKVASGLGRVRGVAVDDAGRRLFVAVRDGDRSFIRVVPL
jgi:sugar lactone lactonase YvrE